MKTLRLTRIGLQFFAEGAPEDTAVDTSAVTQGVQEGVAPLQQESARASADGTADDQLDAEFESLIKGGRFENAFKKRTQAILDRRFKSYKAMETALQTQQPIIQLLSEKFGTDSADTASLLEKLQTADALTQSVKNSADNANKALRSELIEKKAKALSEQWAAEVHGLKKVFPTFDLARELKDPVFTALLRSGLPIRRAYTASHADELLRSAVNGTAKMVSEQTLKSIRTNGSRAAENGLSHGAGFTARTDVSALTGQDIRAIIKQVENGSTVRF